jgi:hypothetical protein
MSWKMFPAQIVSVLVRLATNRKRCGCKNHQIPTQKRFWHMAKWGFSASEDRGRSASPAKPSALQRCTQSRKVCRSMPPACVISIVGMLPAPRINDVLHRVTFAAIWESPQESGSRAVSIVSVRSPCSRNRRKHNRLLKAASAPAAKPRPVSVAAYCLVFRRPEAPSLLRR